jgi:hypothetical protein
MAEFNFTRLLCGGNASQDEKEVSADLSY